MEIPHLYILLLVVCLFSSGEALGWPFISSSSGNTAHHYSSSKELSTFPAKFSIEGYDDPEGKKLVEEVEKKLVGSNTCSRTAYRSLFSSCAAILADEESKQRLAWHLTDCFETETARPALPSCSENVKMINCFKKLDESQHKTYLQFTLQINSICHQLQASAFKLDTERLINALFDSARNAEEKLDSIEEKSEKLLKESDKVLELTELLDSKAQQVVQSSAIANDRIQDVLKHSTEISEQTKEIASFQVELQKEQLVMKEKWESDMDSMHESYQRLDKGMVQIKDKTIEIGREIQEVGESMNSKMEDIHNKANDIEKVAEVSLDNQKKLLDVQDLTVKRLATLIKSQSEALAESREAVERLTKYAQEQQQELISGQEQIQQTHNRLIQSLKSISAAQEVFESKQAKIIARMEKIFALLKAFVDESRFFKALLVYTCMIIFLYMLTCSKQTFAIRAHLNLGLCFTIAIEILVIKYGDYYFIEQCQIMTLVNIVRVTFLILALVKIVHSVYTFRDYEKLNHQLLLKLIEKVRTIEENAGETLDDDEDDDIDKYSWLVEELPEDVDQMEDPDFTFHEEVGENSITNSFGKRYNLRPNRRISFCS